METTPETPNAMHPRWIGNPRQYQLRAQQLYAEKRDRAILPWSYITTVCDVDLCLRVACMRLHAPIRIKYRPGVCVYCGEGCSGVDHLLPQPWTGPAVRHLVAVVPCCRNCNSRIGDHPSPNVSERRKRAQLSVERTNRHLLLRPVKTAEDMAPLGYLLRTVAESNNIKAERVRARLAWPLDPFYDLRAFQKSGIEDPITLGLCDEMSTPLRAEYQEPA